MNRNHHPGPVAGRVRPCLASDRLHVARIINAAAEAYRGIIPPDRWHDPYMSPGDLDAEVAAGVAFSGFETPAGLLGVMGLQRRWNVDLIRHAYVLPRHQGCGVGASLLAALCRNRSRPVLVGTWRAADWAIHFYERHGFARVPEQAVAPLLRTYWTVPDRQIETSVVLSVPALAPAGAASLIAASRPED